MNALHSLRCRLGVSVPELAARLGIPAADVQTLESVQFRLLEIDALDRYLGALGCRLDVVAQHIDGQAHWLWPEAP